MLVRHQLDLGVCVVTDPHEPTDMKRPTKDGEVPVGHYVRIDSPKTKKKGLGYHEESLEIEILHTSDV